MFGFFFIFAAHHFPIHPFFMPLHQRETHGGNNHQQEENDKINHDTTPSWNIRINNLILKKQYSKYILLLWGCQ